jgi:hypothetical protein
MNLKSAAIFASALLFTQNLCAETLFEGFYRIERKGKHVGYVIQRYSHDPKTKTKTVTNYIRTKQGDGEVYESVTATAKEGSGAPVKSIYLSTVTGPTLRTTANFKKGVPWIAHEVNSADNPQHFVKGNPAPMLSAMLYYMTDITKMSPQTNYGYTTFVEQRGRTDGAHLTLITQQPVASQAIYQFVNDSFGQPVENFVNAAGEPLGSRSMIDDFVCYWVPTREAAVGMMEFPAPQITKIFGDLPEGHKNPWGKTPDFRALQAINDFKKANDPRHPSSSEGAKAAKLPGRRL